VFCLHCVCVRALVTCFRLARQVWLLGIMRRQRKTLLTINKENEPLWYRLPLKISSAKLGGKFINISPPQRKKVGKILRVTAP